MKLLLTILLSSLPCMGAWNALPLPPDPWPAQNAAIIAARGNAPPDLVRVFNGLTCSIRGSGFSYYYSKVDSRTWAEWGSRPVLAPGWYLMGGTVLEVQPTGLRIHGAWCIPGTNVMQEGTFFVVNYPRALGEGEKIEICAVHEDGLFSYRAVTGADITLRQFNYGLLPAPPAPPCVEQVQAARAAAEARKVELAAKTLKFDRETAERGDVYSERRMGERYRDGEGVAKDIATAKIWLQKAALQGDAPAQRDLSDLENISSR